MAPWIDLVFVISFIIFSQIWILPNDWPGSVGNRIISPQIMVIIFLWIAIVLIIILPVKIGVFQFWSRTTNKSENNSKFFRSHFWFQSQGFNTASHFKFRKICLVLFWVHYRMNFIPANSKRCDSLTFHICNHLHHWPAPVVRATFHLFLMAK